VTNGGGTGSPMTQKDRPNGKVNWEQLICLELSKCGWGNWPRPSPKLRLGYLSLAGVSCLVVQVKGWMGEKDVGGESKDEEGGGGADGGV
jgi:hypothetical protein